MATSACGRNVDVVDWRIGVAGSENVVRGAVAVNTNSGGGRSAGGLGMDAVRIRILRGGVAIGTGDFCGRILVRQAGHVFVTVDAAKHLAVDGVL